MRTKTLIQYSLTFISILLILFLLNKNLELLKTLKNVPKYYLLVLFFYIFRYIFRAIINYYLYSNIEIHIPFYESLTITLINGLGNFFGPLKVGSGMKIAYLNKKFSVKIIDYLSLNTQYSAIYFMFSLLIAIIFLIINIEATQQLKLYYLFSLIVVMLIILYCIYLIRKLNISNSSFYLIQKLKEIMEFRAIKKNKARLVLFTIFHSILGFLAIFYILKIMNFESTFSDAIFIGSMTQISTIITITPGNIGIMEGFLYLFRSMYRLNLGEIVIFSIISRIFVLFSMFILSIFISIKNRFQ